MTRKFETMGSIIGTIGGMLGGAIIGSTIAYIADDCQLVDGTIPCATLGGVIGLLGGNKLGSEMDRFSDEIEEGIIL